MEPKRAKTLTSSQIRHFLRVTDATSRHRERDVLVLSLGFTCGLRVSEIAQIEIADVLLPSGRLREEVSLRGAITKGSKVRCVYLSHPRTVAALARYIEGRWKHAKVTALERSKWQGPMANIPLIGVFFDA
ncbi:site-specific integrase [Burkholderia sp. S-53]|uniref:site-specific integrase n=1 Tax=Burkholderia sp. S-53 TaxID=2906514 RepID=UPI0021D0AFD4|nr:site-specific integrase [Burkholderia sp. S-53]UXU91124.1 site-specific integrase [Burkholderia sp. S-53]